METGTLSAVIANKLLDYLLSRRRGEAERDLSTGRYLLSYCLPYRVTVIACTALFAGFLSLGIALRDEPVSCAVYSSIFGLATLLSFVWLHGVFLVRTSFSEEGIHREGGLASATTLPWTRIARVDFSESWGSFRFTGAEGAKIRVSLYSNGLATFADLASRHLVTGPASAAPALLRQKALNP